MPKVGISIEPLTRLGRIDFMSREPTEADWMQQNDKEIPGVKKDV